MCIGLVALHLARYNKLETPRQRNKVMNKFPCKFPPVSSSSSCFFLSSSCLLLFCYELWTSSFCMCNDDLCKYRILNRTHTLYIYNTKKNKIRKWRNSEKEISSTTYHTHTTPISHHRHHLTPTPTPTRPQGATSRPSHGPSVKVKRKGACALREFPDLIHLVAAVLLLLLGPLLGGTLPRLATG